MHCDTDLRELGIEEGLLHLRGGLLCLAIGTVIPCHKVDELLGQEVHVAEEGLLDVLQH
jgi:hypothetical protein